MPQKVQLLKLDGMEGSMVQAGNPIAYAYNLDDLYVTANIDEKDIKDVEVGKDVDVTIDGQKKLLLKVKLIVLEKLLLQAFH